MAVGSGRLRDIATGTIFLVMVALIAGTIGCALSPIPINDWYVLNAIRDNTSASYRLMNDLLSGSPG